MVKLQGASNMHWKKSMPIILTLKPRTVQKLFFPSRHRSMISASGNNGNYGDVLNFPYQWRPRRLLRIFSTIAVAC